ncbi:hypothetical protein CDAR_407031 [Caerostris darwini]|uniref:Secreted protein n=1 Tax=Caerostris darwini TaxID=1538125 RepID=A0AAV4ME34_9ARAC|nr:hypothetical protein CDAR_407031 [Caerostris darwini]
MFTSSGSFASVTSRLLCLLTRVGLAVGYYSRFCNKKSESPYKKDHLTPAPCGGRSPPFLCLAWGVCCGVHSEPPFVFRAARKKAPGAGRRRSPRSGVPFTMQMFAPVSRIRNL